MLNPTQVVTSGYESNTELIKLAIEHWSANKFTGPLAARYEQDKEILLLFPHGFEAPVDNITLFWTGPSVLNRAYTPEQIVVVLIDDIYYITTNNLESQLDAQVVVGKHAPAMLWIIGKLNICQH